MVDRSWGNVSIVLIAAMVLGGGIADWRARNVVVQEMSRAVGPVKPADVLAEVKRQSSIPSVISFLEDSSEAVIVVDQNGAVTAWSRGAEELTGIKRDAALGYGLAHIIPPEIRAKHLERFKAAMMASLPLSSVVHGDCITPNGLVPVTVHTHTIPGSMVLGRITRD